MQTAAVEPEPAFRPFNPDGEMRVYGRNLPHWRQPGATYFVTIRQDDSIPERVLAEWLDVRRRWLQAHGIDPQWQESDPDRFAMTYRKIAESIRRAFEREQSRMLHEELDRCHGSCVLRNAKPRQFLLDSLMFFHRSRLWMGDLVIMPNHAHCLITPFDDWELEDLFGSIKKWTSRLIGQWLEQQPNSSRPTGPAHNKPRFWQHESYDRIVRDAEELTAFRRYIARNAETAKLPPSGFTYQAAAWLDSFAERPAPPVAS